MTLNEPDCVLICASLLIMKPREAIEIAEIMGVSHTEACELIDRACKEYKIELRVQGTCKPAYHPCLPLTWSKHNPSEDSNRI